MKRVLAIILGSALAGLLISANREFALSFDSDGN